MARKKSVDSIPEHRTPRSAAKGLYVFPDRPPHSKGDDVGSYPIGDVFHARLALIYVLANKPWFNRDREDVIQAVEDHYPEYNWAAWWNRERRGKPWLRPFKDYLEERYARAANPRNPFTRRKNAGSTIPAKRKLRAKYRKKHGANWHETKSIHNSFKAEWKKIRSK